MIVEATRADLTTLAVDAVVNAANEQLARGSGVCGAIFAAAGPQLPAACAALGGCRTGDAVVTPGFELPASWIIHTVGPVWHGGEHDEPALLASCYRRSLEQAVAVGARSVAFPAISTGVFGYPADEAAAVAVATTVAADDLDLDRVVLVAFDEATLARYERLLGPGG